MAALKVVPLSTVVSRYPAIARRLIMERANVLCRNVQTGEIRRRQFRALYQSNNHFWANSTTWDYFLESSQVERLLGERRTGDDTSVQLPAQADAPAGTPSPVGSEADSDLAAAQGEDVGATQGANFGEEFARVQQLDRDERAGLLKKSTERLNALIAAEHTEALAVAEALVETSGEAALANRATLLEALRLGDEEARAYTRQMVVETHQVVKSTIRLVDSDIYNDDLVRRVVERSNGTVLQHMTRVFLRGLEFLLFYNRQVITRGIGNRFRVGFANRYRQYYLPLLPHIHDEMFTLERVFLGGMKALSEIEINKFATGFLVHDIGKAEDIEYHEGEEGFDRETVVRHVKIGYRAVMDKTNYPREAGLITGYHHEYYGDPSGYGYFREFLQAYKDANPAARQDFVMSYTIEPVIDYEVLAYFAAKMLEIVDVFDSLTDPNRRYRRPLGETEALDMMREEFIEQRLKLDPILFDLFIEFLASRKHVTAD